MQNIILVLVTYCYITNSWRKVCLERWEICLLLIKTKWRIKIWWYRRERGESSRIISLKDWICCPRGGVTLNRSVGSLYIVKGRKQSIWCRYWQFGRSGGGKLLVGGEGIFGCSLMISSIFSVKIKSHQLRVRIWVDVLKYLKGMR